MGPVRARGPHRARKGWHAMEAGWKEGLEDVVAARSAICQIDGKEGRLFYRGYEIGEVSRALSFEQVTHLLWFGEAPRGEAAERFAATLGAARELPAPVLDLLRRLPRTCHPLDALRTAVSLAAATDPDASRMDPEANV